MKLLRAAASCNNTAAKTILEQAEQLAILEQPTQLAILEQPEQLATVGQVAEDQATAQVHSGEVAWYNPFGVQLEKDVMQEIQNKTNLPGKRENTSNLQEKEHGTTR